MRRLGYSRRMMRVMLRLVPFTLLVLIACSPAPTADDSATPVVAPAAPVSVLPATAAAADVPSAPESAPSLALDGEGLRLFDPDTGSSRLLAFGTDAAVVAAALTRALPGETRSTAEETDCGDAVVIGSSGLNTHHRDGKFMGWSVNEKSSVETAAGLGVGDTRAELEAVHSIEVMESTIGFEFVSGDIAGLLESEADTARITHLWAGETCIAR